MDGWGTEGLVLGGGIMMLEVMSVRIAGVMTKSGA